MLNRHLDLRFKVRPLSVLALVLLSSWWLHSVLAEAPVNRRSKVRDLQKQRFETLGNLVRITTERYKNGQASLDDLLSATRAKNEAELDLCTSNQERIAVFEKLVADARLIEEQDAKLFAQKLVSERSFLLAKADRLQQEILLEEARTK